jgi:hypothetical protein
MTATLDGVTKKKAEEQSAEQQAAVELVRLAKEQGLSLTGPDGLLKQLTKTVIETALSEEMTEHLGFEKHDPAGAGTGNVRNGTRGKTVLTEASGHVEIEVPRDRAGRLGCPAAGLDLRRHLHRRDRGEGPRRTGRQPPFTRPSASPWPASGTSSGSGPALVVRARSSGWPYSPI